jgi:hypothetical protein
MFSWKKWVAIAQEMIQVRSSKGRRGRIDSIIDVKQEKDLSRNIAE